MYYLEWIIYDAALIAELELNVPYLFFLLRICTW